MQPVAMMIPLVIALGLVDGAVGTSHPRLRSQNLRAHGTGFGVLTTEKLEDAAPEPLSLLEGTAGNGTVALPSIATLEATMAALEADKKAGKVTPGMENFVNVVTGMIKKEMIPAIMKQDQDARFTLHNFEKGFDACGKIRSVSKGRIQAMSVTKSSTSTNHKSCRKVEQAKYVVKEACLAVVAEKKKAMDTACGAYKDFKKDPTSEANNCHTTDVAEPYGMWLGRNKKYFLGKITEYRRLKGLCQAATRAWIRVERPCSKNVRIYDKVQASCVNKQKGLETATCTLAKKMKDTCSTYETCYDQQVGMYNKQKPKLQVQEKDRKGEFRALKRIECLLVSVFGGDSVDASEIDKCKEKTHSTTHLDLKYPVVPDKQDCEKKPSIPGEKLFAKEEFSALPINTKPAKVDECVLTPAGGVIMGLAKAARKDKCRMDNGWLMAQYGGSCVLAGLDGNPVSIDYTKRRYTKYRFSMKMDETNPRNSRSEGGGFSVCNLVGYSSFANGNDPSIGFVDGVASSWGYHLYGGWGNVQSKLKPASCKDLLVDYKVWGRDGKGIDVAKYTKERLKWIGCMGDGCSASSFFCNQYKDSIIFGSSGTLRALLGSLDGKSKAVVPDSHKGCASAANPKSVLNAMDKTKDIDALCKQLGYTRGTILSKQKSNYCPEAEFMKNGWGSDFVQSHGYGNKFRCQGAAAKGIYTNQNYYKAAEPKSGVEKQWDLTMEYTGGKYMVKSLKIEGVDFSGYAGSTTRCATTNKRKRAEFSPRVMAMKTGKAWIKDFRVFQGNSLTKPMKQVVGQGVGLHAEAQKKAIMQAALAAANRMAKCNVNGVRNGNLWRTRNMIVNREQTVFKKNPRVRRGWNTWAVLPNVVGFKFTVIQRKYQHTRVGLTYYPRAHLHYPRGKAFGIYPGGRLLVEGCCWRRWKYGDTVEMRIEGRNYCSYHNGRKLRCWRQAPTSGKANLQIHIHEAAEGIKAKQICVQQR